MTEPVSQHAVFAGGCFWCVEAVFEQLTGVSDVESGYAGGDAATAHYDAVCSGRTAHAEVVRITYNPAQTTYTQLLEVFFATHDPTQKDRQGNDVGRQYRSAVFYADAEQKKTTEDFIQKLDASGVFASPVVTTLEPLDVFYPAEAYHQDFARQNPNHPYVCAAAWPKVEKLKKLFADRLAD